MKRSYVTVSVVLFVLSLALPAFRQVLVGARDPLEPSGIWPGYIALVFGWEGVLAYVFSWFANPVYLAGIMSYRGKRPKRTLGWLFGIALFLALSTFTRVGVPFKSDATGVSESFIVLMPGFYVWLGSIAVAAIGAWMPAVSVTQRDAGG